MSSKASGETSGKKGMNDEKSGKTSGKTVSPTGVHEVSIDEEDTNSGKMLLSFDEIRTRKAEEERIKQEKEEEAMYDAINKILTDRFVSYFRKPLERSYKDNLIHCAKKDIKAINSVEPFKNEACEDDGLCRRSEAFNKNCIPIDKKFKKANYKDVQEAKLNYFKFIISHLRTHFPLYQIKRVLQRHGIINDVDKDIDFETIYNEHTVVPTHSKLQTSVDEWLSKGGKKKTRRKTITKRKRRKTHRKLKKH